MLEKQTKAALEWLTKNLPDAPGALAAPAPAVGVDPARAPSDNAQTHMNPPLTHGDLLNEEPHTPLRSSGFIENEQNVSTAIRPNKGDVGTGPQVPPISLPNSQSAVHESVMATGSLLQNEPKLSGTTANTMMTANPITDNCSPLMLSPYGMNSMFQQVTCNEIENMSDFETAEKEIDQEILLTSVLQRCRKGDQEN